MLHIFHSDYDLQESIVEIDNERMTLIEFCEVNEKNDPEKFKAHYILEIVRDLLATGEHRIDTGNATFTTLRLVSVSLMSDR